jgi:hypothetical protein
MSLTAIDPREQNDAERWKQWQAGNAVGSRRSAIHARIAISVILIGLTAWLGVLLSSPV